MLKQQWVSALRWVEHSDSDNPLKHDKHHRDSDDRSGQNKDDRRRIVRPDEQRHPEPGHSWSTHPVNCYDEVQAGKNGGEAGYENPYCGCDNIRIYIMCAE